MEMRQLLLVIILGLLKSDEEAAVSVKSMPWPQTRSISYGAYMGQLCTAMLTILHYNYS